MCIRDSVWAAIRFWTALGIWAAVRFRRLGTVVRVGELIPAIRLWRTVRPRPGIGAAISFWSGLRFRDAIYAGLCAPTRIGARHSGAHRRL